MMDASSLDVRHKFSDLTSNHDDESSCRAIEVPKLLPSRVRKELAVIRSEPLKLDSASLVLLGVARREKCGLERRRVVVTGKWYAL